jgi:ABC-type uncharacterized transport system ATPase subunit
MDLNKKLDKAIDKKLDDVVNLSGGEILSLVLARRLNGCSDVILAQALGGFDGQTALLKKSRR